MTLGWQEYFGSVAICARSTSSLSKYCLQSFACCGDASGGPAPHPKSRAVRRDGGADDPDTVPFMAADLGALVLTIVTGVIESGHSKNHRNAKTLGQLCGRGDADRSGSVGRTHTAVPKHHVRR